ncbi:MAG: 50S ribosome-binding GTPase, partial [Actinobacteria bacterium]|nr:50S ribosome-binding GTPase [Actinomycetota bacterium]
GKSTMLRALTSADVVIEDRLFSTLDPTTRRLELAHGRELLLTDTVGFVKKLPHQLVEAFNSTLEEVTEANLLLHVVDASRDPVFQIEAVETVLRQIGAARTPSLLALNKADKVEADDIEILRKRFPEAVFCAASKGAGLDEIRARVSEELSRLRFEVALDVPFEHGELVALVHREGEVLSETYTAAGTHLVARIARELMGDLRPYLSAAEEA